MPAVMLAIFAFTLFLSACLMFIIEMMVGKMMLPLMGGTPAVWSTCMVFYQAVLLAGYYLAHKTIQWLGPRGQSRLQMVFIALPFVSFLLNLALAANFLAPYPGFVAGYEGNPVPVLLTVLTISIGLPMLVISMSAPVLTRWFSSTDHPSANDPYFLYGASNLGSMLALYAYPFFIEPSLTLTTQQLAWVIGYGALALLVATCAFLMWKSKGSGQLSTFQVSDRVLDGVGLGLFALGVTINFYYFLSRPEPDNLSNVAYGLAGAVMWACGFCLFRGRWLRTLSAMGEYVAGFVSVHEEATETPAPAKATAAKATAQAAAGSTAVKGGPSPRVVSKEKVPAQPSAPPPSQPAADRPVTWERRIRWIALAMVPSSLMLGVTTYITTDVAAISFLWVLPLSLYLLTFIIVFATISPRVQGIVTFNGVVQMTLIAALFGVPFFFESEPLRFMFLMFGLAVIVAAAFILRMKDSKLLHRAMVIIMPLLVLLLVFITLGEIPLPEPRLILQILLHLVTLFIVSMVCHGEMAADRPQPKDLTEFFLIMSIGGVLGGLFNGLVAPLIFNGIFEYQLMLVIACLLLPSLGRGAEGGWARWVDVALGGTILLIGLVLILVRFGDKIPSRQIATMLLIGGTVLWLGAALAAGWQARNRQTASWIQPTLAVGCAFLVVLGMLAYGTVQHARARAEPFLKNAEAFEQEGKDRPELAELAAKASAEQRKKAEAALTQPESLALSVGILVAVSMMGWSALYASGRASSTASQRFTADWVVQAGAVMPAFALLALYVYGLGSTTTKSCLLAGAVVLAGVAVGALLYFAGRAGSLKQSGPDWIVGGVGLLPAFAWLALVQFARDSRFWETPRYESPTEATLSFLLLLAAGLAPWVALSLLDRKDQTERTPNDWVLPSLTLLPAYACVGLLLLLCLAGLSLQQPNPDNPRELESVFDPRPFTENGGWIWGAVAIACGVLLWLPTFVRRLRKPAEPDGRTANDYRLSVALDLLMPAALIVLVVGLCWGLHAPVIEGRIKSIAEYLKDKKMAIRTEHLMGVLTFGLPAVLCYTFVERWSRFGLGVGALLLAAGYYGMIKEAVTYQDRSFFGVLKVETSYTRYPEDSARPDPEFPSWRVNRLVHGTTLHGKQFTHPDFRDTPLSYYHRSGPVGQVFRQFNTDPSRSYAVIGLGTGTMASYGLRGQRVDFYDIDPVVVEISYDTNQYFHFVEDAVERDVNVGLILGDARLTFDPRDWRERKKISEAAPPSDPKDVQPVKTEGAEARTQLPQRLPPLRARPWHKTKPQKWLSKLDRDRDGVVHWREWTFSEKEFDAFDKDGDISITLDEATAFPDKAMPTRKDGGQLMPGDKYRLIVVDAFSSDAIPIHLITRQAVQIYLDRLDEDGVLCIHISNRYLDLQPVLANIATQLGLQGIHMSDDENAAPGKSRSHWVMLARKDVRVPAWKIDDPRWHRDEPKDPSSLAKDDPDWYVPLFDLLTHQPRWKVDGEQTALLGAALLTDVPLGGSARPSLAAPCLMGLAMTQVQATLAKLELEGNLDQQKQEKRWEIAIKLTNNPRDPTVKEYATAAEGETLWEPLDTTDYLLGLSAKNQKEIARLAPLLVKYRKETDALVTKLNADVSNVMVDQGKTFPYAEERKKALDKARQEHEATISSVHSIRAQAEDLTRQEGKESSKEVIDQKMDYLESHDRYIASLVKMIREAQAALKKVTDPDERKVKEELIGVRKTLLSHELDDKEASENKRYASARVAAWLEALEQITTRQAQVDTELDAIKSKSDPRREQELKKEKKALFDERQKVVAQKKELEAIQGQFDQRKAWLDRLTNKMVDRTRTLVSRADRSFERVNKNHRVGVWTDDHSNLLSVFNWGR